LNCRDDKQGRIVIDPRRWSSGTMRPRADLALVAELLHCVM
jgi:hypothetical protein